MFLTDCSRVPKLDCLDKRVHSNTGLPCSLAYCLDTLVYATLLCPVCPSSEQSAIREVAKGNVSERMESRRRLTRMKDKWITPCRLTWWNLRKSLHLEWTRPRPQRLRRLAMLVKNEKDSRVSIPCISRWPVTIAVTHMGGWRVVGGGGDPDPDPRRDLIHPCYPSFGL